MTVGVRFADSKWSRGRDTVSIADARISEGPRDEHEADLVQHWRARAWPDTTLRAHVLSPLPVGTFSGVVDEEV